MFVRLNLYNFYLRLIIYSVPLFAFAVAIYFCFLLPGGSARYFQPERYLFLLLFMTVVWAIMAEHYRLTTISKLFLENTGGIAALLTCGATYAIWIVALYLSHELATSRLFLGTSAVAAVLLTVAVRAVFRAVIRRQRDRLPPKRILIVGADRFARRAAWRLVHGPLAASQIVGFVRIDGQEVAVNSVPVYERADLRADFAEVDEILIAVPPRHFAALPALMNAAEQLCVPIRAVVDLGRNVIIREKLFQFGDLQLLNLDTTPAESVAYLLAKRVFDVGFSLLAILVTAPLMAVIAVAIKLTSPGPVLFAQDRIGLNLNVFKMYKFRTMRVSSVQEGNTAWTTRQDPRRTGIGTFLRRTSLDELPQFFNVLRGDMSVVGPRPERPHFVDRFRQDYTRYNRRHRLKVGITGWAQVNGLRGDTSIRKRVRYDLYYLQNWSFLFDLQIVARTLVSGLINKNAY